ncbi:Rqc2 family fibronectin-binding protein [Dubosiella newyorkensis]|uniref:Rqc2 family fibronectin-binding protein n=1 Tax=Dubosiella newyorkensis TaxID=1862672 RepID=UPI00272A424B|nr:NFACT RNA binding domain-containing protein [Dubosiella newyorkensis]
MALDGLMLHCLSRQLKDLESGKIGKIQNLSEEEIALHIHTQKLGNVRLIINVHSNTNRIYFHDHGLNTQPNPSNFVMVLRKYLSQGIVDSINQAGFDRILIFHIKGHNELGDAKDLKLYAELMGKYANLILVDEGGTIIDALKRIPVFENSKRLIHPGAKYMLPPQEKRYTIDRVKLEELDLDSPLTKQVQGFSPLLSKEYLYRLHQEESLEEINDALFSSQNLYVYDEKNFHVLPLLHLQKEAKVYSLMDGLDKLYAYNEAKVRIKEQCGDVFRIVDQELNKHLKKLPKLESSLLRAKDYQKYQVYGDLLFAYMGTIEKEKIVTLPDFESGKDVKIPIDMRFDLKQNANKYYQKYHKMKRSLSILEEQIARCQEDIEYFTQLKEQLQHASWEDGLEIREELIKNKYLLPKKAAKGKKKPKRPHVLHLKVDEADIYVGKNNLQNNYITHHLGNKNDVWFHVKDYHGSHVLLKSEEVDESLIRMCAMLATYFSKGRHSSSVPVDYTTISQLKKVPGSKIGFVTMKSYKTIYIDPDESLVEHWIERYQVRS